MEEGPPRKKRRSKWDMKAPETVSSTSSPATSSTPSNPPLLSNPTDSAAAAAARLNAMLAAQGKLKNDAPPLVSTLPKKTSPHTLISAAPLTPGGAPLLSLIKPSALLANPSTPPLYSNVPGGGGGQHYVQDKIFVGLEQAPDGFDVKEKLQGPNGSYLLHIATQSGAKVFLRGRRSGYIEPTSGKESFEALHIYISHPSQAGLTSARKLCESLIETVKKDSEMFKASQSAPLGFGSAPGYGPPPAHHTPYVNPYQQAGVVVGPPPPPHPHPHPGFGPPPPQHYGGSMPPYHQGQPPHGPPPTGPAYPYYPPAPPPPGYIPPQPSGGGGPPIGFYGPPPPVVGEQYPPPIGPPQPVPPASGYPQDEFDYKPHDRNPVPAPKRTFSEQIDLPPSKGDQEGDRYFSFSNGKNTGSDITTSTTTPSLPVSGPDGSQHPQVTPVSTAMDRERSQPHNETKSSGAASLSKPVRRFREAQTISNSKLAITNSPLSSISKTNSLDQKSKSFHPRPHLGTSPIPTNEDQTVSSAKAQHSTASEVQPNDEASSSMKPPSLPPSSKKMVTKTDSKIMPPPSLPGRKIKVSDIKSSPTPSTTIATPTSNMTLTTSASEKTPPPAPTGALSLVAYGSEESDSDTDT